MPSLARGRVLLAFAGLGVFWGGWGAVLPDVKARAGASDGELGLALLMIGAGALASMRLTGLAIDRRGAVVLPASVFAFGAAAVLPAFAGSATVLAAALLVVGAASGAMDVAINAAASHEESTSGPLMNAAHAAFSAAVLVAGLSTAAARGVGAGPLVVLGASGAVLVVLALWLHVTRPAGVISVRPEDARRSRRQGFSAPSGVLLILGAMGALAYVVENAWQSWSAVHLETTLGAAPAVSSLGPAAFALATTLGRLSGQRLAARTSDAWLLAGGAVVAAVGTGAAAAAPNIPSAFVGIAVAGLGTSVCAPTILGVTGRWAGPQRRGGAVSTVATLAYLGFLVGPAAVGAVSAAAELRVALAAVALIGVALAAAATALPRVVSRPPAPSGHDRAF